MISKSILYFCPENPFPPVSGDKIRIVNLIGILAEHFDIDVLAYEPNDREGNQKPAMIPDNCRLHTVPSVNYKSWPLRIRSMLMRRNNSLLSHADLHLTTRIRQLSSMRQYDYVVVTHCYLGHLLPQLRKLQPSAVLITDAHNFETDLSRQYALSQFSLLRKAYFLLASHWNKKLEESICERTDLLFATSKLDADSFQALSPANKHKVHPIPNFIDARSYESARIGEHGSKPPILIFTGTMSYFPNVNGVLYFYRSIYPLIKAALPDISWHIVGRDCHPDVAILADQDPSIVITGYVPDVGVYMRKASVVIVPLLEGGGTRLKVLEAWACGMPVVSTAKGAEGIACENDHDICLADEPQAFADAVVKLIRDRDFSIRIADNARVQLLNLYEREAVRRRLLSHFGVESGNDVSSRERVNSR
ncbi:glycosyltransferase [Cohnella terricola]|uniref:Glycosyltransferase n=1 Tax=Cohnella terricola TaxID=1289167 RepID=A0A559JML4_9BACL|nr:glycosyltransferase [Cohnella terricola]TVY01119.1 glycosyltransferase [Cohnella terricola]